MMQFNNKQLLQSCVRPTVDTSELCRNIYHMDMVINICKSIFYDQIFQINSSIRCWSSAHCIGNIGHALHSTSNHYILLKQKLKLSIMLWSAWLHSGTDANKRLSGHLVFPAALGEKGIKGFFIHSRLLSGASLRKAARAISASCASTSKASKITAQILFQTLHFFSKFLVCSSWAAPHPMEQAAVRI